MRPRPRQGLATFWDTIESGQSSIQPTSSKLQMYSCSIVTKKISKLQVNPRHCQYISIKSWQSKDKWVNLAKSEVSCQIDLLVITANMFVRISLCFLPLLVKNGSLKSLLCVQIAQIVKQNKEKWMKLAMRVPFSPTFLHAVSPLKQYHDQSKWSRICDYYFAVYQKKSW